MRYCGSKAKLVKDIVPIITEHLKPNMTFVDAFMGGANVISEINHDKKIGIELNPYVCYLWKTIQQNELDCIAPRSYIPTKLTKEEYIDIKNDYLNKTRKYPAWLIGYVGSACSFGSAWFNGYGGYGKKRDEDHIKESFNGLSKHIKRFKHLDKTRFICASYDEVNISGKAVIYCDPPYMDTKKYMTDFDHNKFWDWVREMSKKGHYVYVSEYNAPSDFKCIWEKKRKDSMGSSVNGVGNLRTEKLFIFNNK